MTMDRDEHRLLYRIAQAYYSDGQTQQEIARRFGLSRPKVSRLLQKARDARIVHITLMPPSGGLADLERELEQRYALEEAVLVACTDPNDSDLVALELGAAAADCLLRSLTEGSVVGLAWGRSILALVDALPVHPVPGLTIVQVSGGLGPVGALEHSTEVARRAAQKLGARLRLLPAPGIVSSVEAARALRADYQISEVLGLAAQADVAVLGLGVPAPDSVLLRDGKIITAEDLRSLQASGAVGDLALRYVDAEGRPVELELNERIIGLTLEQIARIPRVIGVAGGAMKREIVLAALRAGILDVLVTDQATAEGL
jgi:DNA-binding transcriptional regulator LsrR (DeoR family)